MKIEIYRGKHRKPRGQWRPVWFVRMLASNGNVLFSSSESYNTLASAVNALESLLTSLKAEEAHITILHGPGVTERVYWVIRADLLSYGGDLAKAGDVEFSVSIPHDDRYGVQLVSHHTFIGKRYARPARNKSGPVLVRIGKMSEIRPISQV